VCIISHIVTLVKIINHNVNIIFHGNGSALIAVVTHLEHNLVDGRGVGLKVEGLVVMVTEVGELKYGVTCEMEREKERERTVKLRRTGNACIQTKYLIYEDKNTLQLHQITPEKTRRSIKCCIGRCILKKIMIDGSGSGMLLETVVTNGTDKSVTSRGTLLLRPDFFLVN